MSRAARLLAAAAAAVLLLPLAAEGTRAEEVAVDTWSARLLHCATSTDDVRVALERLEEDDLGVFGLPKADPDSASTLLATRVDLMLRDLARSYEAYPEQRARIERVVLSWNYCDVFYDQQGWDLHVTEDKTLERTPAAAPDDGWQGFRAWGMLPNAERIVPVLFDSNPLFPSQRQWFASLAFSRQCFPDPVTGLTVFDARDARSRVEGASAVARDVPTRAAAHPGREISCEVAQARSESDRVLAAYEVLPTAATAAQYQPITISAPVPADFQGDAPSTLGVLPPKDDGLGMSGSLFASYATWTGKASLGARVAYSPIANSYVRAGLSKELHPSTRGRPTYTWGIGYSDWHPGTCSVELNSWGATPIDTFDLRGAQVDLGCKIPLPELISPYLGLGVGMTFPLKGGPSYGGSLSIKPGGRWFVMMGLRYSPSRADAWSFSYGFGNWSARPYTFSLSYNNWGPNSPWHGNFDKNGSLTFAWSWVL